MKAADELLGAVFNKDHRYVIPNFQRPYVWDEAKNWLPLWEDLRKAAEGAEKGSGHPEDETPSEYFLGAFVTQSRSPVPRRTQMSMVIDGQQRLTTFQVFLAAARRVAVELDAVHAADSFAALVRNRVSQDTDHPEDRYKVVPLAHDAPAFEWAVRDPGHAATVPDRHHRLARASHWFESALRDWVAEAPSASERLDFLHFAVENRIKVVSIYLDPTDDPQVIFEALNHRGVRLDAADLVKNFLFQLLDRQGDHHLEGELLTSHWSVLDSDRWRSEVTTGRIKRVRVDSLLAYWLAAQRGEESSVEHLFEDIKRWMRTSHIRAADVIRDIRVYADTMERLQQLPMTSSVAQALDRLDATGTTTPWPLVLFLHATREIPQEQAEIGTMAIDSFLMRRAICRLTTSDYNRLFGSLLGSIKAVDPRHAGDALVEGLAAQTAPSRMWPDDAQFARALGNHNLYNDVTRPRLRSFLVGLENALHTSRSEPALPHRAAAKHLTIEHVMPVKWEAHWGLPTGATEDEQVRRQEAVHRLGNLTLATQSLNSSLSNEPWAKKRQTLQTHSLARLTTASILTSPEGVHGFSQEQWTAEWDEQRISLREKALVREAMRTWPRSGIVPPNLASVKEVERGEIAVGDSAPLLVPAQRQSMTHDVQGDLLPLIQRGLVAPGDILRHTKVRSGRTYTATITPSGGLDTVLGPFRAPSTALTKMLGSSVNGWITWTHIPSGKTLAELREMLRRE